jgi:hypothetical protein
MRQEKHFIVDILFVLALFGIFAVSALVVVTIGADIYQRTVQDMSSNYDSRTAISYLTEKVRRADSLLSDGTGAVTISEFSGEPALVLTSEQEGERFCTLLYYHDGYLKELFMREGADLGGDAAAAGEKILQLSDLEYSFLSDRLLSVSMTLPDGETKKLYLTLRCR